MARGLSYADAVRLLGGREDRMVAALDRAAGGLLLVASAVGAGFTLSLFDPKSELARLSGDLVTGLAERLRGVSRLGRSERLAAAHAVIVLTAYFESLREARLPFDVKELKLTGSEQVAAVTGGAAGTASLRTLADALLRADVPMPAPPAAIRADHRDVERLLPAPVGRTVPIRDGSGPVGSAERHPTTAVPGHRVP